MSILTNTYFLIFLKVVIFGLIFLAFYLFVQRLIDNNVISTKIKELNAYTEKNAEARRLEKEKRLAEDGFTEEKSFLTKLDDNIIDSGMKDKFPFLNAETLIMGIMIIDALLFLLLQNLFPSMYIPLIVVAIVTVFPTTALKLLSNRRKRQIDDELVNFINLIENYSKTSDDIITIIGRSYIYLNEPLRTAAEECYLEGNRTGDVSKALDDFSKKINHKKFKTIVRNLSICSRYEANYDDVAEDSRQMIIEYLAGKRERAALIKNARVEMCIIMFLSCVMFYMMGSFIGENIIKALQESFVGTCILYAATGMVLFIIASLILMGKESD